MVALLCGRAASTRRPCADIYATNRRADFDTPSSDFFRAAAASTSAGLSATRAGGRATGQLEA
jgi:hypothetical protein